MSHWDVLGMTDKITDIMQDFQHEQSDPFGQPFVSPYQIVIAYAERFPEDIRKISLPLCRDGIDQHDSLAEYIARELTKRIFDTNKNQKISHIEGAWLHEKYVQQLAFDNHGQSLIAPGDVRADFMLFRLRS